ncbi:hypothetical protein EK0264_09895 [Epidermidibacterium keratini]|uniref:Uncharacterized protein n=1 Tax=Epidermidibacterium keratini TaxID=1891644 RepID=A0A7L4YP35_9ACTN|nr:hypothetical protein [Epidermidibacterium keratini]QHC00569.1 hypothetical protein EK0264_09895 [Epidermidibacterium keratini]
MPNSVLLTVLLILGFLILAAGVMGILGWLLVLAFRAREKRRGPSPASEQSYTVANGLFELGEIPDDDPPRR